MRLVKLELIGLRRLIIFLLLIVCSIPLLLALGSPLLILCNLFIIMPYLLYIAYMSIEGGVYNRKTTFIEKNSLYEVRDLIFLKNMSLNYRELYSLSSKIPLSRIFFNKKNKWGYLDIVRLLLEDHGNKKLEDVLILGGAGCCLALTISEQYHNSIAVVEISSQMIQTAQKFFLPLRNHLNKISLIHDDAYKYISYNKKKYDAIIIDVFNNRTIPNKFTHPSFVVNLKKCMNNNSILIHNLGLGFGSDIHSLINNYRNIFGTLHVYRWNDILLGSSHNYNEASDTFVQLM